MENTALTLTAVYQAKPDYILRHIASEDVLVAIGSGVADFRGYITMNRSAVEVWKALRNEVTESQIVDALTEIFDADRTVLAEDVHTTLGELVARNMVDCRTR